MTPEIVFGQGPKSMLVQRLWRDPRWRELLLAIVVDEVHCIDKWGSKFRPEYNRLGELRVWSPGVPFLGVTATLTDDALANTTEKLFLDGAYMIRVRGVCERVGRV